MTWPRSSSAGSLGAIHLRPNKYSIDSRFFFCHVLSVSWLVPGFQDLVLLAAPMFLASLLLVFQAAAWELKVKIVTNDRYRDWVQDFPEVQSPGQLVRGGYRPSALWLDEAALGLSVSRTFVAAG